MKVLVAPLDWGLGHATRCVPVIREFLCAGAEVHLGVCGNIAPFYKDIFPDLKQHRIPSYKIKYPNHGYQMPGWILKELPTILKIVAVEHALADSLVKRENFDIVFSDNRFGFYSEQAKSIYMTHQLRIAFPGVTRVLETVGVKFHQSQMAHFNEIWIPDVPEYPGLGGRLSHLKNDTIFFKSHTLRYVGPLSRFEKIPCTNTHDAKNVGNIQKRFKFMGVVSGTEPSRTNLENRLRQVFHEIPGEHALLLGKPGLKEIAKDQNITVYPHLPTQKFAELVQSSEFFVSRPGYSTVMDQAVLGANCLFVPTPGQTEQVYLGKILKDSGYAQCLKESQLTAKNMQQAFDGNPCRLPQPKHSRLLKNAIQALL